MKVKEKKPTEKKRIGQRGKAKPIIDIKILDLEKKENLAKEIILDLEKKENLAKKIKNKTATIKKKKTGRNETINPEKLQLLKVCFSVGMTDEQACYFSGVKERTLYYYQNRHPELLQEKEILKDNITLQSRLNVGKAIKKGSVEDSWKRLYKKDPEFKGKVDIFNGDNKLIGKITIE